MAKAQLNVTIDAELAKQLKLEAVQMGMRVSRYVELILQRRRRHTGQAPEVVDPFEKQ